MRPILPALALAAIALLSTSALAQNYPRAGFTAQLSTLAHGVSGRVTIVDADTLRVDNFNFDGLAIQAFFRVAPNISEGSFATGLQITPSVPNTPFVNATLTLNLPAGTNLDNYNAVSFWCAPAGFSFGKGTFGQAQPQTYCTGKLNSVGCTPSMSTMGLSNSSGTGMFLIRGTQFRSQQSGILFYGYGSASTPFQGGTLCIASPIRRTSVQNAGGSASGADCTGVYSLDFNARIASGVDPLLTAGRSIHAQYYARDMVSSFGTSLSNAVSFTIAP